ncbi:hypothetical protein J2S74_002936 [Evansella vedderi]|uniref:Uncharacterized protein n=1 Tax=Evansella vedderi TaxID=38282 RepID=A0ABT9ZWF6_9BACI|nr:hypothetical protein [Evansella vedderi]MDQ0255554.1 hypothetical protein [Evansella vedderi]
MAIQTKGGKEIEILGKDYKSFLIHVKIDGKYQVYQFSFNKNRREYFKLSNEEIIWLD